LNYLTRRQVLGIALAGLSFKFARAADTDPSRMIVRSPFPTDFEMPLDGFTEAITPIQRFFVRCHTNAPTINLKTWRLKLDGVVNRPLTLTMDELRKFPRRELVSVLECAGNGRAFYQPPVAGAQWSYGGAGNGRWAGVRLRDLLQMTGVKSSAKQVLFTGADSPFGAMEHLRRGVTIEKALHPDTLLAYEMNGQPLPVMHGFPLRVIVPGWAGDSWIKWLQQIEVLDHEYDGFWMKSAYRYPKSPVQPGAAVNPSETVPVTNLGVKSIIAKPAAGPMLASSVTIAGAAWSDGSPVTGVDVSTDGGLHWTPATFGKDLGR
jgi:sulfite oxidase